MRKRFFASLLALGMLLSLTVAAAEGEGDASTPPVPEQPVFIGQAATPTGDAPNQVTLTLQNAAPEGTAYKVYDSATDGTDLSDTVTARAEGANFTLELSNGAAWREEYYISAVDGGSNESERTKVAITRDIGSTLTVDTKPCTDPKKDEVAVTVAGATNSSLYYKAVTDASTAPKIGDLISASEWASFSGGTVTGVSNGSYILVVQGINGYVAGWGISGATNDGFVPTVPAESLTVAAAALDQPQNGKIKLSITPEPNDLTWHYSVVLKGYNVPDQPNKGDSLSGLVTWQEIPTDKIIQNVADESQIVVAAVNADGIAYWGVSNATSDGYTQPGQLTGTAEKASNGVVTLTVNETVGAGNVRYFKLGSVNDWAEPNAEEGFDLDGWTELSADTEIKAAAGQTHIAIVEINANGTPDKWGIRQINETGQPGTLAFDSPTGGGIGGKVTVEIEEGHWLTIQVENGSSVAISSIEGKVSGPSGDVTTVRSGDKVKVTFSAKKGSKVSMWESASELTFDNGIPTQGQILARGEIASL